MSRLTVQMMRDRFGFNPGDVTHDLFARQMAWFDHTGAHILDRDLSIADVLTLAIGLFEGEFVILVRNELVALQYVEVGSLESVIKNAAYMFTKDRYIRIEDCASKDSPVRVFGNLTFPILNCEEALTMVRALTK